MIELALILSTEMAQTAKFWHFYLPKHVCWCNQSLFVLYVEFKRVILKGGSQHIAKNLVIFANFAKYALMIELALILSTEMAQTAKIWHFYLPIHITSVINRYFFYI